MFSDDTKALIGVSLVTAALVFVGIYFGLKGTNTAPSEEVLKMTNGASHSIAVSNPEIIIIEFADYQSSESAMYYPQIMEVVKEYEGKASFYYRHFVAAESETARKVARAAEAAADQSKFWEMNNLLFSKQSIWINNPTVELINLARELGLNEEEFKSVLESAKHDERIDQDTKAGKELGINSMPAVFVNSNKMTELPTADNLRKEIQSQLSK